MLPVGSDRQSGAVVLGHCCCPADSRDCGAGSWDLQNSPVELGTGLWEMESLQKAPDLPCSFLRHLNRLMLPN